MKDSVIIINLLMFLLRIMVLNFVILFFSFKCIILDLENGFVLQKNLDFIVLDIYSFVGFVLIFLGELSYKFIKVVSNDFRE